MDGENSPIILPPSPRQLSGSADLWGGRGGAGLEGNEIVDLEPGYDFQGQIDLFATIVEDKGKQSKG